MAAKVTVTNIPGYTTSMGNRGAAVKRISWDNGTYPAGGLSINRASFGLRGFDWVGGAVSEAAVYNVVVEVDRGAPANVKLHLIILATGLEVAVGAALTPDNVAVFAVGG